MHQGGIYLAAWKDQDLEEKLHYFLTDDSLDIRLAFSNFG